MKGSERWVTLEQVEIEEDVSSAGLVKVYVWDTADDLFLLSSIQGSPGKSLECQSEEFALTMTGSAELGRVFE